MRRDSIADRLGVRADTRSIVITLGINPMSISRLVVLSSLVGMTAVAACFSGETVDGNVTVAGRTCEVKGTPQMAPGGYYTQGASVCTADGKPHLFNGVDRPS